MRRGLCTKGVALWLVVWLALVGMSGGVWAQEVSGPEDSAAVAASINYEVWNITAERAETSIEAGKASDQALETLRGQIAEWREKFLVAQGANKQRIATIQNQLAALGPVPETGTEAADIAIRRTDLNTQLARLQAPVSAAEEAYSRANGIITEIDRIIRERQANALISIGPSPLNPAYWNSSVDELSAALSGLWNEFDANRKSEVRQAAFRQNMPITVAFALTGFVLLLRGRWWAALLGLRVHDRDLRGRDVWHFMISLGKVLVPVAGLVLLTQAVLSSGFVGFKGSTLVTSIPQWGTNLLIVRWLSDRLFPDGSLPTPFSVAPEHRAEVRRYATALAVFVVLADVARQLSVVGNFSPSTDAVIGFPLVLLTGLVLFRTGQFLLAQIDLGATPATEDLNYRYRLARLVARAAVVVAVVGPLLWAVGYRNASEALIYPSVTTLAVLGMVVVLQRLVSDLYALVTGRDQAEPEALLPVLVSFALTLAAVPFLALVWGARVTDLTEIWSRFREGFSVGDTRISPTDFLMFAVVFGIGYMMTRLIQGALRTSILPKTKIDPGGQNAIVSGLGYVGIFVSGLVSITSAGIDLSSIAIVAGALSVGIGFGLQNIVSNFVSGIILLIERPVSEGDWIEVGGTMGYVRDISVRSTRIETFDRSDVIIPNSDLISGTVTNYTHGNTLGRVIVPVGVAYGTDTRKVEALLREIGEAHPMALANPAPQIYFRAFGADSLDFEIRVILRDVNWSLTVKSDLNHEIAKRFAEEGIEIPFAQRDVWLRNPEVLRGAPTAAPQAAPEADDIPDKPETTDDGEIP
ncbi:DUF3772 domain-containing protein [Thalassovita taeanensis]|uniref:Small-conductance mechanosensitive channel n=1 Tax=Thalassovita taeanensis TaxID=657014 RepID=A0A1H9J909_9RHOB|nr:DUF3772 domain-containing protein [Thalassovita taeanensis]SEQ83278.1 Small-conductance mechanosensitive channel [Thalassovita taeanensis]